MKEETDARWLLRYGSYAKALSKILEVVESGRTMSDLSDLEKEGLVQRFEYAFELAWKTLQDLLIYRGYEITPGPNYVLRKSFEDGLITDHDGWRKMAKARNITTHTYDEEDAAEIVQNIYDNYAGLFKELDYILKKQEDFKQL
ncbi:MAG: HI0074 family nucleotidyltransferase substrate-binding subunit [Bacteroidia bacterium]|nr:HI0074 family nucleotidyltransferase substrate-binding subunit [Bacteroidia bacterium]